MSSWLPTAKQPLLGNFVIQHALLLNRHFKITIIQLLEESNEGVLGENIEGVNVNYAVFKRSKNPFLTLWNKRCALKKALCQLKQVDYFHGHIAYPDGWMFSMAKNQLKVPFILIEHGSYYRNSIHWGLDFKWRILPAVHNADRVLAVSDALKQDIKRRFPSLKVGVIGNPVNEDLFLPSKVKNDIFQFVHISTLDPIKRTENILRGFKEFIKKGGDAQLLIISDEDASALQQLAHELDLNSRVMFMGPLSPQDVAHELCRSHVLVMNSYYESFSIVIAEAWSCGIPIISTPVGIAKGKNKELGIYTSGHPEEIGIAMELMVAKYHTFKPEVISQYSKQFGIQQMLHRYLEEMEIEE